MPVFSRVSSGAAFDSAQLDFLRQVFDAVCTDLAIPPDEAERRERVALVIMALAGQGEMDGEMLRRRAVERANDSAQQA